MVVCMSRSEWEPLAEMKPFLPLQCEYIDAENSSVEVLFDAMCQCLNKLLRVEMNTLES